MIHICGNHKLTMFQLNDTFLLRNVHYNSDMTDPKHSDITIMGSRSYDYPIWVNAGTMSVRNWRLSQRWTGDNPLSGVENG